ncbi:uncharacterized protein LOC135708152 isoform X2 [Ochlerotatus camptorhynchus]|uniref:uncharacterized protein LOC135708152 isoform X2 n=1 Tax=Ochlerotatus camptorhynchus TaxID=644619 RepID=UPI0031D1D0EB
MSVEIFHWSKVTKRARMKVKLALNGFFLGVLLVSHADAGVIEISAYGNVSRQRNVALRNSSDESAGTGRAMNNGGFGNIFDGMLTKPINLGTSRSHDSYSTKYIDYPSYSPVGPPKPLKVAVASDQSTIGEANDESIYNTLKDKQENRKGYQYQQHNATSFNDSKANPPSSPPPPPSPSPAPPTGTIPVIPAVDHDQDFDYDRDDTSPTTNLAPLPPPPLEYGTARVKAYSYFYLSRTLWYVPLYFTLYFCFYILILVLRSIARHKVSYPNNFTGTSRSLQDMQFITNEQAVQKADMLTTFVMKQIDDFKEKNIG